MLKNHQLFASVLALGSMLFAVPSHALSEANVQSFARTMSQSANRQNIGQISALIDDSAVIALTRHNKTTTLDKNGYLQLLQKSWANSTNYQYSINISDVVITGNQAKAQVTTVESWIKDNKKTTMTSNSRVTLTEANNNAVLLRSVAQITVD